MRGAVLPLPQYTFVACCSLKAKGYLYIYPGYHSLVSVIS